MANYDLVPTIGAYLDRHLVLPLYEFLSANQVYANEQIVQAKLSLLSKTKMVDFAADTYTKEKLPVPESLNEKRVVVIEELKKLTEESSPLLQALANPELLERLVEEKLFTFEYFVQNHNVTLQSLEAFYKYAKFHFDCGIYTAAGKMLEYYLALSNNPEKNYSALWGKLACEILMHRWPEALEDLNRLIKIIDTKPFESALAQLQHRAWVMHWGLFVFFNHPNGRDALIETFFQEKYSSAIQTTCPHLLRYLTAAVVTNVRRKSLVKTLVKLIQQESYTYRDPITELVEALYVNFDFEEAQNKLRECREILANDPFLVGLQEEFIENARNFIFETYCRIHQSIDVGMMAEKLNLSPEAAERWIVNLIRDAHLDAKIDSARNAVIMNTEVPSIYQQVIEKTKGLSFRSYVLANNISRLGPMLSGEEEQQRE